MLPSSMFGGKVDDVERVKLMKWTYGAAREF
jgi:hypothetical protein